ncbi:MAG: MFS transporter [Gemmatimonadaceae bacterium]
MNNALNIVLHNEEQFARATLRRVSIRILPLVFILYIFNFVDRTNVAMAALQMNRDLHFSSSAYGLGAGIFFVGYAIFEVPSNIILARVGASKWIARIMISWGLIASAMMFVHTPIHFYILRFLLGVAEAGFFPGIIYYLSKWFPTAERARALAWFTTAVPLSAVLGGPLGGALLGLDGVLKLAGWQWLFVAEGIPAVILGIVVLVALPDQPSKARWLSGEQSAWLTRRLLHDQNESAAEEGLPTLRALMQRPLWILIVAYFLFFCFGFVYFFWAPTVIHETLGGSAFETGVVVGIIALLSAAAQLIVGVSSDRTGERALHVAACGVVVAVGYVGAALLPSPIARIGGLALVSIGATAFLAPLWCIPSVLLRGTAAAAGIALVNAIGSLGGFVGPYATGWLRDKSGGTSGAFLILACLAVLASVLMVVLSRDSVLATSRARSRGAQRQAA